MPSTSSSPGDRRSVRIGKYEIISRLTSGALGTAYQARDVELGRIVMLKTLPPELVAKGALLERFRRTARAAAQLRHENLVTLHEFGEEHGTYFLAFELMQGIDLSHFSKREGPLRADDACQILKQAARALDHAHRQGFVHGRIALCQF